MDLPGNSFNMKPMEVSSSAIPFLTVLEASNDSLSPTIRQNYPPSVAD